VSVGSDSTGSGSGVGVGASGWLGVSVSSVEPQAKVNPPASSKVLNLLDIAF
jgi:hypothetical protein